MPVFSIITPVYNAGPYLARTIDSALKQDFADFEFILVNDGSTDEAFSAVRHLKDQRLRLIEQANLGAPAACNAALAIAGGEYVSFLDQDDLWAPRKLSAHLAAFRTETRPDITFTGFRHIGPDDMRLAVGGGSWSGPLSLAQLFTKNVMGPTSSVALRRDAIEAVGGFDASLPYVYDLDLHLRILRLRPDNALGIPDVLTFYRRHPGQMSGDWRALRTDWRRLLAKFRRLEPQLVEACHLQANGNMLRYLTSLAYARNEHVAGLHLMQELLIEDPAGFLRDPYNWKLAIAGIAGMALEPTRGLKAAIGHRQAGSGALQR